MGNARSRHAVQKIREIIIGLINGIMKAYSLIWIDLGEYKKITSIMY